MASCKCGCGLNLPKTFYWKAGRGKQIPKYIFGHYWRGRKRLSRPAWNKGLSKEQCPTLTRMGFQPGHKPYNNWSKVNARLKNDPEFKQRWRNAKKGHKAWNKGKTKSAYPKPTNFKSGSEHPRWKGNPGGFRDLAIWKTLSRSILERDNFTCQSCGIRNQKGLGKTIKLHAHHVIAFAHDPSRTFDPTNLIALCESCHHQTDTFGSKANKHP